MQLHTHNMSPPFGPYACDLMYAEGDKEDDSFSKGDYSNALAGNTRLTWVSLAHRLLGNNIIPVHMHWRRMRRLKVRLLHCNSPLY